MKPIEIVSASAGSGKTYHLASLLREEVGSGRVRPDAILATTFTNKAAAELQERVRTFLLRAGRVDEAQRLAASRIGTVNAVCGRLVGDLAFELGLSPHLTVLDEGRAERMLRRALTQVLTDAGELAKLAEIRARFGDFEWLDMVQKIVERARTNDIPADVLAKSAERSVSSLLALLDTPAAATDAVEQPLVEAMRAALAGVDPKVDSTKATREARQAVSDALQRLEAGQPVTWKTWLKLGRLECGKKSAAHFAGLRAPAAAVLSHAKLHDDLSTAILLVFGIAARALLAYASYKREWGVIDFIDQERLALQALRREDVRERLRGEIDLVLVDEFQDTSPLQLAIFLELAKVAKRSVWVGDQKQSIFGFRGADPALMDAAIDQLVKRGRVETLPHSYRSRPELVDLASDLFVEAFGQHGFPEERVRLRGKRAEPEGMAPECVEVWRLHGSNVDRRAEAVAAGVQRLLVDSTVTVEDRQSKAVRPIEARDVAILCRNNDVCAKVATALAALGIRAELPRSGLTATLHGVAALAGLALWVDPGDSLAAAQIARIVDYADRPDAFLRAAIAEPYGKAFAGATWLARLRDARDAAPNAGPTTALDAVLSALELRELCLRWPDSDRRLADLDALRAHAEAYAEECLAEGVAATPAGLIAHLEELADDDEDSRAAVTRGNAVTLCTWHRSKGLEWPVVVLHQVEKSHGARALDEAIAESPEGAIDLADPLADRWIRYWPNPFPSMSKGEFFERIAGDPSTAVLQEVEDRQNLRLHYVGWTRARDRLVIATEMGRWNDLSEILGVSLEQPVSEENADQVAQLKWGKHEVQALVRNVEPAESREVEIVAGVGYDLPTTTAEHPPAFLQPSALEAQGEVGEVVHLGERLPLHGSANMAAVGEAVHGFLAADLPGRSRDERLAIAAGLLDRWTVSAALDAEALLTAGDRLRTWVSKRWPTAVWRREWPVAQRLDSGTLLVGRADLVLEVDDGLVIVDHKSFPGTQEEAVRRAAGHAGQLAAYGRAVSAATGRPVVGMYVHLAVLGAAVEVSVR